MTLPEILDFLFKGEGASALGDACKAVEGHTQERCLFFTDEASMMGILGMEKGDSGLAVHHRDFIRRVFAGIGGDALAKFDRPHTNDEVSLVSYSGGIFYLSLLNLRKMDAPT